MTSATRDPVSHSFALLEAINRDGSRLNLSQLAAEIGVHKSSASRLLTTLVEAGYAARDPQTARYVLGPKLVTLAVSILQHHGITTSLWPAGRRSPSAYGTMTMRSTSPCRPAERRFSTCPS